MTHKRFTMIERAARAAERLRKGESAQNVLHALGFYDQAHLINSLREIIGQTPSELADFSNTRVASGF
jgi:methylphosphotriester-DNA--protein-cysteine methyltransferase